MFKDMSINKKLVLIGCIVWLIFLVLYTPFLIIGFLNWVFLLDIAYNLTNWFKVFFTLIILLIIWKLK